MYYDLFTPQRTELRKKWNELKKDNPKLDWNQFFLESELRHQREVRIIDTLGKSETKRVIHGAFTFSR